MNTVPVDDLQPGMVLASDAVHHSGRVLLRSGTSLEEKHIRIFKAWGLTDVAIEGFAKTRLEATLLDHADPAGLREAEDEVRSLFRHTDLTQPVISELYHLLVQQRAEQKTKGCHGEMQS